MSLTINHCQEDSVTIVTPVGRLDGNGAPIFETQCSALLDGSDCKMIVDMSGIDYLSSAGLRSLLIVAKKVKSGKGALVLCALPDMVAEVMTMSGFASFLTIKDDLPQALAALGM